MSKKRYFELGRKWRLGKLNADYKDHKALKKSFGYLKEPDVRSRSVKAKKRIVRCKHEYEFSDVNHYYLWITVTYSCLKCNKRKQKNVLYRSFVEN